MQAITKRLYIIDGNSILHRAWHAIPPLTTHEGLVVNAVYGFATVIDRLILEQHPTHLVVCWDVKGGTFRDEVFDDYKAGREVKEQELYDQVAYINEILDAYGIPYFGIEGYEADDLIGTIAEIERHNDATDTVIITGDLDALQLVDDSTEAHIFVKGFSNMKVYDVEAVRERFGFGPDHVIDYKALAGDSSDNIPGVKGIGAKTATTLIQLYGDLDGIYAALNDGSMEGSISPGVQKKLREDEKNARMSLELATIMRDVPMKFSFNKAQVEEADWQKVKQLYKRFEFANLLQRLESRGSVEKQEAKAPTKKIVRGFVIVDATGDNVSDLLDVFSGTETQYALEVVSHTPDLFGSSLTALALSNGLQTYVFPSPSKRTIQSLLPFLVSRAFITYDLKRLLKLFETVDATLSPEGFDVMVASYLVSVGDRKLSLDSIFASQLGSKAIDIPTDFTKDSGFITFGNAVAQYVPLAEHLTKRLQDSGMQSLYETIEHPLIQVLFEMERDGVMLDVDVLKKMSKVLEKELETLTKQIWKLAGRECNINSPSQLAEVLFTDLQLPVKGIKKTKTGYSTAASELEKLWETHAIVPLISQYREMSKLKSTYVDALPELVGADGRLHTSFNQTVAATGRLSSSDPNLQNIPIRTELGREIRKAFVTPKGHTLLALDYSQIELRLVAAFSKDEKMIKVFTSGGDIHKSTAAEVFNVPEEEVTKEQRRAAKAVNFGIIYGMGPRALSRNIDVSFQEAKEFIERYFEVFPAVRAYLDASLETAKEAGYAETLFGRRRELPDLDSGMQMLRASAERMAVNMPLQGAAADMIKMAMVEAQAWLMEEGYGGDARMILQVHDELVFEVKDSLVDTVAKKMKAVMEGVVQLPVPLTVDVEVGQDWKDMQPWNQTGS
ncbi:DNA polymerase I [Candidatus Uhrbacteria bacterium CG10_big_fil_rev_8_21_14_0_10_50_16]|uniref:DNA polymerase I n=1 Tax=Candidatus Uhrbacteria bacterium CG10_big_fil_rev_8_21_14_0_10_50_16 TaxID=1975039 RepID=A0A2H0RLN3_9BACT|nr:MAG: DNA polymerase I [Candidatus Uhrbacteria bacterium CG10_big_fil_rev_8_21_14_0_10_50_16]